MNTVTSLDAIESRHSSPKRQPDRVITRLNRSHFGGEIDACEEYCGMEEEWGQVRLVRSFIVPLARKHNWQSFCEIGASTGETTNEMLRLPNISYTIIDPCFDADLEQRYASDNRVSVLKGNSLDVLPIVEGVYDCILIDGDHNWYTVLNELRIIRQRNMLRRGGMIFFHDVGWPYARRDLYYQPETIPSEHRQEYKRKGIVRGRSNLVELGGTNEHLFNCTHEGGVKNGVLTAIENFLSEYPSDYKFSRVRYEFGLGFLQFRRKEKPEDAAFRYLRIKAALLSLYSLSPSRISRVFKQTFFGNALKLAVRRNHR
jgi:predicted O-methyltransferase YrrM